MYGACSMGLMEQLLFRTGGGGEGELGGLPLLEPDNVNKLHNFVRAIIE